MNDFNKLQKFAFFGALASLLGAHATMAGLGGVITGLSEEGGLKNKLQAGVTEALKVGTNPFEAVKNVVGFNVAPAAAASTLSGVGQSFLRNDPTSRVGKFLYKMDTGASDAYSQALKTMDKNHPAFLEQAERIRKSVPEKGFFKDYVLGQKAGWGTQLGSMFAVQPVLDTMAGDKELYNKVNKSLFEKQLGQPIIM